MKYSELAVFVLLLVFAAGLTGYQAHLGGRMVYEYGAGVIPMEPILQEQDHEHDH